MTRIGRTTRRNIFSKYGHISVSFSNASRWVEAAVLIARLILSLIVLMAFVNVVGISATASFIALAGFPFATLLAVLAARFEVAIILILFDRRLFCRNDALEWTLYCVFGFRLSWAIALDGR
jgi:hypothetical protein